MSAKRIVSDSNGPRWFRGFGISGLGLVVLCACSGSIETTDVDERRADVAEARGGGATTPPPASGSPTASSNPPASTPPASTPPASTPPASTPPASTPQASNTPPASTPPASTPPPVGAATVSFETDIWPIFNGQCAPCHTVANIVQNIGADDKDAAFDDAVDFKDAIVSDIQRGTMPQGSCSGPPGSAGCVSEADFDLIKAWVEDGTPP